MNSTKEYNEKEHKNKELERSARLYAEICSRDGDVQPLKDKILISLIDNIVHDRFGTLEHAKIIAERNGWYKTSVNDEDVYLEQILNLLRWMQTIRVSDFDFLKIWKLLHDVLD